MQKHSADKLHIRLYILGWLILAAGAVFYILVTRISVLHNLPCIFLAATGLYCPGCGATRAVYLLIHGKPLLALWYYPAVPYAAVLYLWFMISNTVEFLSKGRISMGLRYRNLYLYIAVLLILGSWLVKNLLHLSA